MEEGRNQPIPSAKWLILVLILVLASSVFLLPAREAKAATSTFYTSTDDGDLWGKELTWVNAWGGLNGYYDFTNPYFAIGTSYVGSYYYCFRGFGYFDTSSLPDAANITAATLEFYIYSDDSSTSWLLYVQNGQPTYPHQPAVAGDYLYSHYGSDGGSFDVTSPGTGWKTITLNANGRSWISKTGTTKLALRSQHDIAADTPAGMDRLWIYSKEQGESWAMKLSVTYNFGSGSSYGLTLHGPYYENGFLASKYVTVKVYFTDNASDTQTLDGTDGVADTLSLDYSLQPLYFAWNLTTGGNKTRTIFLTSSSEEHLVLLPDPDEPYYLYTFYIADFFGMTNPFLETSINVNGTTRTVERQASDAINPLEFWMTWQHFYTLKFTCDEGTFIYGDFQARSINSQTIIITADMIPQADIGLDITVNALRINATFIQVNYTDSQVETYWLAVTISHKAGYSWLTDYTTNNTGNTQQINWYDAEADKSYKVSLEASRASGTYTWSYSISLPPASVNPWTDLLSAFGTGPFPLSNLFGFMITLCFFGMTTYLNRVLGCVIGCIVAGVFYYIGWLSIPSSLIVLALVLSAFFALTEAKRQEREL